MAEPFGVVADAIGISSALLEKRRRIFGEDHPSTIIAMNNLASTLGEQG